MAKKGKMEILKRLKIRTEVINFATLPIVLKINPKQLLKSFDPFMTSADSKINLDEVSTILCQLIPNFTEKDVHVLFILYRVVVDKDIEFLSSTIKRNDWGFNLVNARKFCLFMFLQNYRTNTDSSKKELNGSWGHNQFNEGIRSSNQHYSPMNSPRTKMNRQSTMSENSNLKAFVKTNIHIFLRIVSGIGDFKSRDNFSLRGEEIDHLDTIFAFNDMKSSGSLAEKQLSAMINGLPEIDSKSMQKLLETSVTINDGKRC